MSFVTKLLFNDFATKENIFLMVIFGIIAIIVIIAIVINRKERREIRENRRLAMLAAAREKEEEELKKKKLAEDKAKRENIARQKFVESHKSDSQFVALDVPVQNVRDISINRLHFLNECKNELSDLNAYFNASITNTLARRDNTNLLTTNEKELSAKFVLRDIDETSPFYFSVLNFKLDPGLEDDSEPYFVTLSDQKVRSLNWIDDEHRNNIIYDITMKPASESDNLEVLFGNISDNQVKVIYTNWIQLVEKYKNFRFDISPNDDFADNSEYSEEEKNAISGLIERFAREVEQSEAYKNEKEVRDAIDEIKEATKSDLDVSKGAFRKRLFKPLQVISKYAKQYGEKIMEDLIVDFTKQNLISAMDFVGGLIGL